MPPRLPPELTALISRQRGLITRAQLCEVGVSDEVVLAQLRAQRWTRLGRGLYATFTGELLADQKQWAAVLASGPGSVVSHSSAGFSHDLLRERPALIDVTIPAGRRIVPPLGVVLHRSRFTPRVSGSPPMTDPADTLCDLAGVLRGRDELAAVVGRAVQRRLVDPRDVARALDQRGRGHRGSAALAALIADASMGAHSALEVRYLRDVERRHRLPLAQRQHRIHRGGRTRFRDAAYPDWGLVIELDGRLGHDGLDHRFRDLSRDVEASLSGEVTLRFGWWDVASRPCEVARQVVEVLRLRGWAGSARKCGHCGVLSGR